MSSNTQTAGRYDGALQFMKHEAAGGVILLLAAISALVLANSPLSGTYQAFLNTPVTVRIGDLNIDKPLLLWINDGLMAIFFFLVGLEIKRELLVGELSSTRTATLPAIAAFGGILVPALIYVAINAGDPVALNGWAIPAATDIAFAVGLLAVLGSRIPPALKAFLLAVAIIDDLAAIIIIAVFYTAELSLTALAIGVVGTAVLVTMNLRGVTRIAPYVIVGTIIWVCVLKSGVHATLAGVVTALLVPMKSNPGDPYESPLLHLEHALMPWVKWLVLPLFAFGNAGVSFVGITPVSLLGAIPLGITLGLLIGKPVGIFGFTWLAVKLGLGDRPQGTNWMQILGVGFVAGIGFTMSLFIGMLAFPDPQYAADIRIGVLCGSILSAICGYFILLKASPLIKRSSGSQPAE
ncbi:MAG: Na+/H+ antiporter NhaA [Pseudomonadota bacterium]